MVRKVSGALSNRCAITAGHEAQLEAILPWNSSTARGRLDFQSFVAYVPDIYPVLSKLGSAGWNACWVLLYGIEVAA